ncbi:hypothetical protein PCANB_001820 [Pneumocystis canis]|nr:hypothetical protein PCK1_002125 [Pneumocystis canis]KAG5440250.1 hypothetical protein PCANB_001820 [Pneumocystis canis]
MSAFSQFALKTRKIVCVGWNYAKHKERKVLSNQPAIFLKPSSSLISTGHSIQIYPGMIAHHEVELAVVIGETMKHSPPDPSIFDKIAGYALAIDVTARNFQDTAKKTGMPWTISKGFDTFCPISEFIPKEAILDPYNCQLYLKTNGILKQHGSTQQMIYRIPQLLSYISSIMTLEPNDIVLTGTPEGADSLEDGDIVYAGLIYNGKEVQESKLEIQVKRLKHSYIHNIFTN